MSMNVTISAGRAAPLAAVFDGEGMNFAVFSAHATRIMLYLFASNSRETYRTALPERDGDVRQGYIAGLHPGQL